MKGKEKEIQQSTCISSISPHLIWEGLAKPHLDICIKQAQQGLTQDRSLKPPGFLPVTLDYLGISNNLTVSRGSVFCTLCKFSNLSGTCLTDYIDALQILTLLFDRTDFTGTQTRIHTWFLKQNWGQTKLFCFLFTMTYFIVLYDIQREIIILKAKLSVPLSRNFQLSFHLTLYIQLWWSQWISENTPKLTHT